MPRGYIIMQQPIIWRECVPLGQPTLRDTRPSRSDANQKGRRCGKQNCCSFCQRKRLQEDFDWSSVCKTIRIAFTDSKQCSSDSSEYESCSEEEEISVSEEEEIQTENELESASETPERSCSDDTSADEGEEMKKSDSLGKQKPTTLNSSTYAKTIKKAKKIN